VLPFTSYAQNILFDHAKKSTAEKKDNLNKREEKYNNWMKTNKKRKTRQAMLEGKVPPEQTEFEHDKKFIEGQIDLCIFKENTIKVDKE